MSERLIIRNFGPIKDVELELKKFNVIIGENATGKSTVAKLLAVCRYFTYINGDSVVSQQNRGHFLNGLYAWGIGGAIKKDTYIKYECEDYIVEAKYELVEKYNESFFRSSIQALSNRFKKLIAELDKIMPKGEPDEFSSWDLNWTIPTSFYKNEVARVMDYPFYIPTERGLQSLFSLGKNPHYTDSLFNQLADLDSIIKSFTIDTTIEPLKISFKNEGGQGKTRKYNEDDYYTLYNGASGFQSAIPIVLVIKYYNQVKEERKTFIIEEPELNLFPNAQKEMVNFLVENINQFEHSIFLTTHSPYILTSLNNLMYAYEVGKNEPERVNKVVDKKHWIDPTTVSAYRLFPDGTCESIISSDEDGMLIRAEKIDEISGVLNEQFDALLNIELVKK